jgi:NAD(P)-dependent dehydrogenase (short-subunit alcohol dehydrogenase family)
MLSLSMDKRASSLRVDAESTSPKVVVITGASAGVGRAAAIRFARDGVSVALIARGEAGLEGARRDVEAAGGRALVCSADVADPWAVDAAAARAEAELGPIDVWVNCATVTVLGEFETLTMEEFKRITEVGYLGYVHGTHAALSRMLPRDAGTIVQVGSTQAAHGLPLQSAYCGAKQAIRGFTESLRSELGHRGSRVWLTEVQLPALNTPQLEWCKNKTEHHSRPLPPVYEPEVAAEAVHFAAHARRRELTVGGAAATAAGIAGDRGWAGREYDGPPSAAARYNLWQPVDDDADGGVRGPFGARAYRHSVEPFASKHKGLVAAAGVGAAALLLAGVLRGR